MSQEPPQGVNDGAKISKDPTSVSPTKLGSRSGIRAESNGAENTADQGSKLQSSSPEVRGGIGRIIFLFILLALAATATIGTASWWGPRAAQLAQGLSTTSEIISEQSLTLPQKAEKLERLQPHRETLERGITSTASNATISPAGDKLDNRLQAPEQNSHTNDASIASMSGSLSSQAQQLASVTARLAKLEATIGNIALIENLNSRISVLEGKSADATSVLNLSNRLTAVEDTSRRAGAEQAAEAALLIATAELRVAVVAGQPFALELETAKVLSARVLGAAINDRGFATYSMRGIPSLIALQRSFDETASQIIRAAVIPDDASGWLRQLLDRIMSIVTVRRVNGSIDGKDVSAVLARAENHLKAGDLKSVSVEMATLTGASTKAATPWFMAVNARIAADQAINATLSKAMALMAVDEHTQEPMVETSDTE